MQTCLERVTIVYDPKETCPFTVIVLLLRRTIGVFWVTVFSEKQLALTSSCYKQRNHCCLVSSTHLKKAMEMKQQTKAKLFFQLLDNASNTYIPFQDAYLCWRCLK